MESEFVRTDDAGFVLGGKPFRVAGANNYYLGFASDFMVSSVFDLAATMDFNVLRTWAFLDCGKADPGTTPPNAKNNIFFQYLDSTTGTPAFNDGPNGLERLDRTVAFAEKQGIRLILPLINYWPDFGGVDQYLQWFGFKSRADFYREATLKKAYQDYAEHLLVRRNTCTGRQYRDEPAILAWELMNEPRCVADDGGRLPGSTEILLAWADEMSSFLKSLDSNHMVAVGDEGYFRKGLSFGNALRNGAFGVDCEAFLNLRNIDFGTCHLYPAFAGKSDPVQFGADWIREHIELGRNAGKPMLIEEYGSKADPGLQAAAGASAMRTSCFDRWLTEVADANGAGALLWMIAGLTDDGQRYPDYDGYTVYTAEDVPPVLSFARAVTAFNEQTPTAS